MLCEDRERCDVRPGPESESKVSVESPALYYEPNIGLRDWGAAWRVTCTQHSQLSVNQHTWTPASPSSRSSTCWPASPCTTSSRPCTGYTPRTGIGYTQTPASSNQNILELNTHLECHIPQILELDQRSPWRDSSLAVASRLQCSCEGVTRLMLEIQNSALLNSYVS